MLCEVAWGCVRLCGARLGLGGNVWGCVRLREARIFALTFLFVNAAVVVLVVVFRHGVCRRSGHVKK